MNTVVRIDPLNRVVGYPDLHRNLFADVFRAPAMWSRHEIASEDSGARLPIDAYVTDHEIVVQAALPGVAPENVNVSIEAETLTLSATLPERIANVKYIFAEQPHAKVFRRLALNVPVDVEKAEASFENGLLTLTLPKAETARPKSITVKSKAA